MLSSYLQSRGPKAVVFGRSRPSQDATFHIITPALEAGDAVSNDVFGMQNALESFGLECMAYAEHTSPELVGRVVPLSKLQANCVRKGKNVLVLHHSTFWEYGEDLYNKVDATKIIKYHNITPAHYFAGYSDVFTHLCESGRKQTSRLVQAGADLFLGDSEFNVQELIEAGASRESCQVVSPFHHADELFNSPASIPMLESLLDGHINISFVGRFAPNKGHLSLLRTFEYFRRVVEPRGRLILVGKSHDRLQTYMQDIQDEIVGLGLEDSVSILNYASSADLRAVYLASHIFLCLSEHEGFCVPLIEAMLHKIPIVALNRSAIPETLGPQGFLTDTIDEVLLSEMMAYCIQERSFNRWLTDREHERYVHMFTNHAIADKLLSVITPLTPAS
jgi:glycosyltransferase involved in cell wall biosynthesis